MDSKASGRANIPDFQTDKPSGNNWLLAIAIDKYKHCAQLNNCVKDTKDFVQILQQRYRFDAEHTVEIINEDATRKNILKAFRDLQEKIQPADNLLVYFSGHGDNVHQIGYWIPVKAQPGEEDEYINADEIIARLNAINSFHTFLIVDACFSGSLFQTKNASNPKRSDEIYRSRWGLTASHSRELALDGNAGDNSPFAECLLLKLRQSIESFSIQDLATFVKNEVRARTREKQTPVFQPLLVRGHELGQFVFHLQENEGSDWEAAQQENTIPAYRHFRRKYPNSVHYETAKQKIKDLEEEATWQKALRRNKVSDYETAKQKIKDLEEEVTWQKALRRNKVSDYEDYLDDYPNGIHAADANQQIDALLSGIAFKTPAPIIIAPKTPKLETPRLSFEPDMIFVPGGTFQMGSNDFDDEKPIHEVTVKDFYIGKYPVTFAEYDAYCEATGREKPSDIGWGRDRRPVIYVIWNDARDYCEWLSKQIGKNYRLPTEAEWEYAARGGNQSQNFKYAGSDNLEEVGWYEKNSDGKIHPVGQQKANELGIYDMSGSVWEWCEDVWHRSYEGAPNDSKPWLINGTDDQNWRVARGGSWNCEDISCRVSDRNYYNERYVLNVIGFRLARD